MKWGHPCCFEQHKAPPADPLQGGQLACLIKKKGKKKKKQKRNNVKEKATTLGIRFRLRVTIRINFPNFPGCKTW